MKRSAKRALGKRIASVFFSFALAFSMTPAVGLAYAADESGGTDDGQGQAIELDQGSAGTGQQATGATDQGTDATGQEGSIDLDQGGAQAEGQNDGNLAGGCF